VYIGVICRGNVVKKCTISIKTLKPTTRKWITRHNYLCVELHHLLTESRSILYTSRRWMNIGRDECNSELGYWWPYNDPKLAYCCDWTARHIAWPSPCPTIVPRPLRWMLSNRPWLKDNVVVLITDGRTWMIAVDCQLAEVSESNLGHHEWPLSRDWFTLI